MVGGLLLCKLLCICTIGWEKVYYMYGMIRDRCIDGVFFDFQNPGPRIASPGPDRELESVNTILFCSIRVWGL